MKKENPMKDIRIEKVTLNIGAGTDPKDVDNAVLLLNKLTNRKAVKTYGKKRIPTWNLREGVPVGAKVTLRGKGAHDILVRLLDSISNVVPERSFTSTGFSFGIPEYIQIEDAEYDPKIGIIGLEVAVTFERPGFRIKRRKIKSRKLPKKHELTKEEIISYAQKNLKVKFKE
ncbi:MAG: 50S ribosomal protein L5 [Candidatus Woesearchaeota archaeon]|nr:MAG: 50S ribosomal protein L5 [Candidatus Woesearchaeota archaeon]